MLSLMFLLLSNPERSRDGLFLQTEWIGLFSAFALHCPQWRYRMGFVEPDPGVELLRQDRGRIMAPALGVGTIDDADEALQPGLRQPPAQVRMASLAKVEQEALDAAVMGQALIAVGPGDVDPRHLHRPAPVGRCGDGAVMRAEPDQARRLAMMLAAELADVEFAPHL